MSAGGERNTSEAGLVGTVEGSGGYLESVFFELGAGCEGIEEVPHESVV